MSESLIVALLSLAGTLLGSLAGVLASCRLTNFRLEQLERRVQAHNSLITRMYGLEGRMEVQEEKMKAVNHRIDGLEHTPEVGRF